MVCNKWKIGQKDIHVQYLLEFYARTCTLLHASIYTQSKFTLHQRHWLQEMHYEISVHLQEEGFYWEREKATENFPFGEIDLEIEIVVDYRYR